MKIAVQNTGYCSASNVFSVTYPSTTKVVSGTWLTDKAPQVAFKASNNWTGATSSNGNHSHTITLTKSSIYGNSETVQPPALLVRVKCRYY